MKTEVYSWRVSTEIKAGLQRAARRRKMSLAGVLDLAAREWLSKTDQQPDDEEEQRRLHKAAAQCFGSIKDGDRHSSENVSKEMRRAMQKRYGR
jgi:hypothetical protein